MQVLIATYGHEGIKRVAAACHPRLSGVTWLVSWQKHDDIPLPEKLMRSDMWVVRTDSIGLSNNRNNALANATEDEVLISDDDVMYTPAQLMRIKDLFSLHTELDILTFRYIPTEPELAKIYPEKSFDLAHQAKGYYITSFEMALRLSAQRRANVWFDPRFGVNGTLFPAGEESLFLHYLLKKGLRGRFFNEELCTHAGGATTSERMGGDPLVIGANAVYHYIAHPATWPARLLLYAMRQKHTTALAYLRYSLQGIKKYKS